MVTDGHEMKEPQCVALRLFFVAEKREGAFVEITLRH
jgi:hypothetical protein